MRWAVVALVWGVVAIGCAIMHKLDEELTVPYAIYAVCIGVVYTLSQVWAHSVGM